MVMRARWFNQVRELISGNDFIAWWKRFSATQMDLTRTKVRLDELLTQENLMQFRADLSQQKGIDRLYLSGSYEEKANQMQFVASELENKSYSAVAKFEEKRIQVSELWFKVGALEHRMEELRTNIESLKSKQGQGQSKSELAAEIKLREVDMKKLQKEHKKVFEDYELESAVKQKLWAAVEEVWGQSLECNLKSAEGKIKSRSIKNDSEGCFIEAEVNKRRAQELSKEVVETRGQVTALEEKLKKMLDEASTVFNCIALEDFLYWQERESNRFVYCVPLVNDAVNCNIELKALAIYQVDRQKGVEFIEPAMSSAKAPESADRRLDNFFANKG